MALRDKLARLEKAMQDNLSSIELADGSRYWFDPQETGIELFRYLSDSLRAAYHGESRPEPPPLLRSVAAARDRREAFSRICSGGVVPSLPVDVEALIERGKFVPRPLVRSKASGGGVGTT
jgi:hypothetical protein